MSAREKSSGWKIPLIFCAAVAVIAATGSLVISRFRYEPDFPPDLLELAKQTTIDLNAARNKPWREAVINAASGFAPYSEKDAKLATIAADALAKERTDMALAAVSQMRDGARKNESLENIFERVLEDCAEAPRAPGIIKAISDDDRARQMSERLSLFWSACREKFKN